MRLPDWQTEDSSIRLYCADCLDVLPELEAGSVDACITDPPFGKTQNKWDEEIPAGEMWTWLEQVCSPSAPIVLSAAQPYTSLLVTSRLSRFRYAIVWDKVNKYTDFLNAPRRPMRRHEDLLVFSGGEHTYNPQMEPVKAYKSRRSQPSRTASYGKVSGCDYGATISEHNPCSVVAIESHATTGIIHPTQKPVELLDYLVRTYSNAGDLVLDFAAGSFTTGVACIRTGRKFIGIEKEPKYFAIAVKRIEAELSRNRLFEPAPKIVQRSLLEEPCPKD